MTEIERLYLKGFAGAAIARKLAEDEKFKSRAPGERVVQKWIRKLSPLDRSGEWRSVTIPPHDGAPNQAAVLPVLGWLMAWSGGARTTLTNREAQWISSIKAAVPTIPPNWAYMLARRYVLTEEANASTERLDRLLAIAPWHDRETYDELTALGLVERLAWERWIDADDEENAPFG